MVPVSLEVLLVVDGASTSQTGWLLAGDYIQLGTGAMPVFIWLLTMLDY
jgi:hypothetical protein